MDVYYLLKRRIDAISSPTDVVSQRCEDTFHVPFFSRVMHSSVLTISMRSLSRAIPLPSTVVPYWRCIGRHVWRKSLLTKAYEGVYEIKRSWSVRDIIVSREGCTKETLVLPSRTSPSCTFRIACKGSANKGISSSLSRVWVALRAYIACRLTITRYNVVVAIVNVTSSFIKLDIKWKSVEYNSCYQTLNWI